MTNYKKGYVRELMAMKELEDHGYTVVRSSGSHGPVDLVAFNRERIRLIQMKSGRKTGNFPWAKSALKDLSERSPMNATVELWIKPERLGWIKHAISKPLAGKA